MSDLVPPGEVRFCGEAILSCELHFVSYATPLILKIPNAFTHLRGGRIAKPTHIRACSSCVYTVRVSSYTEVLEHKSASTVTIIIGLGLHVKSLPTRCHYRHL